MAPLIFALTAPIIGVLLYPLLHDRLKFRRLFDRSMYVIVPVLVLSQVIGHEIAHSGWAPKIILILLGIMTLGIFIPIVIEHMYRQIAPTTEALSIIAGFLGLGLHALLEGASLNAETPTAMLPIMVHRLTVAHDLVDIASPLRLIHCRNWHCLAPFGYHHRFYISRFSAT